jgi:pseudo-rSAM protein
MDRLILNSLPPVTVNWALPAISVLKGFMEHHGYNTEVHYWNLSYEFLHMDFFKTQKHIEDDEPLRLLNSNFFGNLTVLPDGDILSNINAPVLGNIATTPLLKLIAAELEHNHAWRKTRNEHPCNNCLFQYLCPPVSNYETVFKKMNLCTL